MTEHEKYLFDLQGYLVIPNALDSAQVRELNRLMDEHFHHGSPANENRYFHFRHLLTWGKAYRDLLDTPRITPILRGVVSPYVRLDHEYAVAIRRDGGGPHLHGGGADPFDYSQYYVCRQGTISSGLTVVAFNLRDCGPDEGGFACIPGSHKANFRLPKDWINLDHPAPCVQKVHGPAGTAVIFSEALTHGTLPWRGAHERRTLFYKYSPHTMAYYAHSYYPDDFADLTPEQRSMLEPPSYRNGNGYRVQSDGVTREIHPRRNGETIPGLKETVCLEK